MPHARPLDIASMSQIHHNQIYLYMNCEVLISSLMSYEWQLKEDYSLGAVTCDDVGYA